jgi:hypothetical protein
MKRAAMGVFGWATLAVASAAPIALDAPAAAADDATELVTSHNWVCTCRGTWGSRQYGPYCAVTKGGGHLAANRQCEKEHAGRNACKCGECRPLGECKKK